MSTLRFRESRAVSFNANALSTASRDVNSTYADLITMSYCELSADIE